MADKSKMYTHEQVDGLIATIKAKNEEYKNMIDIYEKEKGAIEIQQRDNGQRSAELDRREAALVPKEDALTEKERTLSEKQAELEAREIAVVSQEKAFEVIKDDLIKASDELAAKKSELFKNAENLAAELHNKRISEIEDEIQSMADAAKAARETARSNAESEAQKIRDEASAAAEKIRGEAQIEKDRIIKSANEEAQSIIENAKSDTDALERQVKDLMNTNATLSGENTELRSQNQALSEDKKNLDIYIKEQKAEFDKTTEIYETTMKSFETLRVQLESSGKSVDYFTKEIENIVTREQELNARENELNERDTKLKFNEKRNQNKTHELEELENNINDEIEKRYPEIIADKDSEIELLKQETKSLRDSLYANTNIITKFDDLTAQFGNKNPAEILLDYQRVQKELALALDKLSNTPSYALQKTAADLQDKENALNERENALAQKERQSQQMQDLFTQTQAENGELKLKYENLEKDKKFIEDQLNRLRSTYENPAERDDRIKDINKPLMDEHLSRMEPSDLKEIDWLNGINKKIRDNGFKFPRRILYAFHTALKTSEMSPITVLAGVSGTGKSELPRLYSRFGGINFLGVPVQPNWDCQEAMLGYYNSIDNCFEPTDMLRMLAQSQRDIDDQNGLSDVMTMILLDEMNLANVELYFADFLSKLETRRGLADSDLNFPYIGVKIGSKMQDFPLRLGRNVLWVGTMNNDETTKTLSDKVLDRGIVINFPRPKELIRSRMDSVLAEPSPLLRKSVWNNWIDNAVKFTDEQIKPYIDKITQINEQLGKTGRALGHRVWQSIENYMSLYPNVIAAESDHERICAMNNAFEDQLVQKVMPKLRGLETRGTQKEVLDTIKGIIPETLHEDFQNAVEQNYGQFIWTTSGYLLRGEDDGEKKSEDESK